MSLDPMEAIVSLALVRANISFVTEIDERAKHLDFYLPDFDVHIEVKQFHSVRIAKQMARADNVIAIQGIKAAQWFASRLVAFP